MGMVLRRPHCDLLALLAEEERRYDRLPAWAWRRPIGPLEAMERRIAATESALRENDRALADGLARIARLHRRHRVNRHELARALERQRAALGRLRRESADPADR
jgi:hypothetical protein